MALGFDLGSAIGGIAQGVGGYMSAAASAKAAKEMQQKQLDWERERANNAHQWEVQDLKAAGLNPILSAGGQGAETGGISAPLPDMSGIAEMGNAVNTAFNIKKTKAETQNIEQAAENIKKDTELKEVQKGEVVANTALRMAEKGLISEKTATETVDRALKKAQQANVEAETKATISKLGFEMEQLRSQINLLKSEKKFKEAQALEKQLDNKYYALNLITNKLEQASRIGSNSASAFKNVVSSISDIAEILPAKKAIGFVSNMLKK